jgi:tetratricopeptide (TPR) repeat protein
VVQIPSAKRVEGWAAAKGEGKTSQKLQGEFDKAIKSFQAALKIDANYEDALLNLGLTYEDMDNLNEALEQFRKVVR